MAKKESNLASVLSFEKKLVLSDGYMYGTTWEKRNETARPVMLVEKSVRGTISNRLKDIECGSGKSKSADRRQCFYFFKR